MGIIEQASSYAAQIDNLILIVGAFVMFWFVLAQGIIFYFLFRYRKKRQPKAEYITGEKHSETKFIHWAHWGVIACDLVIIFFAIKAWYHVKQELPTADTTIKIVGQQWAWEFTHPGPDNILDTEDDIVTIDELHIEVGKVHHYKLSSKDVLHDFSVPVFRLKQDAVPGRVITGWFKPIKTGEFDIQCAEMCGIGHGIMAAKLYINSKEDHAKWLESPNLKYTLYQEPKEEVEQ